MDYMAVVSREGRHWLAEFPDCAGCQTFAESEAALPAMAREALEGWLKAELQARRVPPRPKRRRGGLTIRIEPRLAVKVALRQVRDQAGLSQAEVAKAVGVSQQAIAKLEDPDRGVELDTVARVAAALNYALSVDLVPD